jgi:hypothetical protein
VYISANDGINLSVHTCAISSAVYSMCQHDALACVQLLPILTNCLLLTVISPYLPLFTVGNTGQP